MHSRRPVHMLSGSLTNILPGFDIVDGQATPGRRYRSAGLSVDNLQAVHAYCDKPAL